MEGLNFKNPNINHRYMTPSMGSSYSTVRVHQQEENPEVKTIAKAGLLQAAAILLTKVSEWCGQKLMQGKEFTNARNINEIAEEMLTSNNLKYKISVRYIDNSNAKNIAEQIKRARGVDMSDELNTVARGANAFYSDGLKLAVAPKSKPSLILHELGHAITAHKGKFMKFLQKSRIYAASVPTILLMFNDMMHKKQGEETFIERHAGKIGFCAFLPTIIEEGLASWRGISAAEKIKKTVSNMDLKPLKRNYAFAWLTYVISGLGLGVAAKQAILENKQK